MKKSEKITISQKKRLKSLKNLQKNNDRLKNQKKSLVNIIINNIFINSFIYCLILKLFGIKVGLNTKFQGPINFILNGKINNIFFGKGLIFGKNITLKIREDGKIILEDKVYLDDNVRLIAARSGSIHICEGTNIGYGTIINSGGNVSIGKYCLISNNCNINSSSHGIEKENYIIDQKHLHGNVSIGDDVWLGGFVTVTYNTNINEGAVVGANSLVSKDLQPFSVNVGCPAKKILVRK